MKELTLMASDKTFYTVLNEVRDALKENGWPEDIETQIAIAVEEIYVNIAHYAYGGKEGEAKVRIDITPKNCRISFADQGIPYNPLEKEDPDLTLSAEDRPIGGLGIFMVKEMMDRVTYEHKDGKNILTIEKTIE
ncbi:MAG: ATP-binding protein [Lachnospiraceae bacterium]|nr:ATP-binding protein [Lachnospiraceae bacterium]